jgi:bifunctional non-homologous end joining protein LigD
MSAMFDALTQDERELLRPAGAPERAELMKAVLTDRRFSDPDWIFERKLDGIRCLAVRTGDRVRMLSRNNLDLATRFPELIPRLGVKPAVGTRSTARSSLSRDRPRASPGWRSVRAVT